MSLGKIKKAKLVPIIKKLCAFKCTIPDTIQFGIICLYYVEINCQLDETDEFLLQILLLA
jgi:hypothetical protein